MKTKEKKSTYRYDPLDRAARTIRLVRLLPESHTAIRLSLQTVRLEDVYLGFEAISYAWGSPNPVRHVIVNGKRIQVRDNIWQCLNHLRRQNMTMRPSERHGTTWNPFRRSRLSSDWLWIDCICINQADTTEKEQQVAMMADIFSSAFVVFIWLGPTSSSFCPDQEPAHLMLRDAFESEERDQEGALVDMSNLLARLTPRSREMDPVAHTAIDFVMHLLCNGYWHRLWVLQEISLAPKVFAILGDMLLSKRTLIEIFMSAFSVLHYRYSMWLEQQTDSSFEDRGTALFENHPILGTERYAWNVLGQLHTGLGKLIEINRTKLCTVPRDRVYGLLGLARPLNRPKIDYQCSDEEVLLATMACIEADIEYILFSSNTDAEGRDFFAIREVADRMDHWTVACLIQALNLTAVTVRDTVIASPTLSRMYQLQFQVKVEPLRVLSPLCRSDTNEMPAMGFFTFIESPAGETETFQTCITFFADNEQVRYAETIGKDSFLMCSIGSKNAAFLLSMDEEYRVELRNFCAYQWSRYPPDGRRVRSQVAAAGTASTLSTKLNALNVDWKAAFDGSPFSEPLFLSALELVELAGAYDMSGSLSDARERYENRRGL